MSHRSKGVMVKGEQLPGNCVLLGKGSLMAPVGPALWAVAYVCRDMQPCTRGFLTCSYHNSELEALTACVGNESARVLVNTHALLTPAPCFSATRLHELPGERISAGTRGTVQAVFMCTTLLGKRFNCLAPLNLSRSLFFFFLFPIRLMRRYRLTTSRNSNWLLRYWIKEHSRSDSSILDDVTVFLFLFFLWEGFWDGRLAIHWCEKFWPYTEELFGFA